LNLLQGKKRKGPKDAIYRSSGEGRVRRKRGNLKEENSFEETMPERSFGNWSE